MLKFKMDRHHGWMNGHHRLTDLIISGTKTKLAASIFRSLNFATSPGDFDLGLVKKPKTFRVSLRFNV